MKEQNGRVLQTRAQLSFSLIRCRGALIRHSALLISDLGIYFSNPRGTYIEQEIPGEPEKKTSEK